MEIFAHISNWENYDVQTNGKGTFTLCKLESEFIFFAFTKRD